MKRYSFPTAENENDLDPVIGNFVLYNKFKVDNDYVLYYKNRPIPTKLFEAYYKDDIDKKKLVKNPDGTYKLIFKKDFIERLNPDLIDPEYFWSNAVKYFPFFSMISSERILRSKKEVNTLSDSFCNVIGFHKVLKYQFKKNPNLKILEIGPGYGNLPEYLKKNHTDENYYAIDVTYHFWHDRLHKCDGKTIPDSIPDELDIVFASNVFQHLGTEQRNSYYKEIHRKLKKGGIFIFNSYILSDFNKNRNCWSYSDEDCNFYCKLFNQFTIVEKLDDMYKKLNKLYNIDIINLIGDNAGIFMFTKK